MNWVRAIHRRLLPDDPSVGWKPYLWLVYLAFFGIRYLYVTPNLGETLAIIASLVAFLCLYFNAHWHKGWRLVPNLAGIVWIGTMWAPLNIGAGVFFIYATGFAAFLGPTVRGAVAIGIIIAWGLVVAALWQSSPVFWLPVLVFGPLIGVINLFEAIEKRRDAALHLTQEEVRQLAQVAERERISRDLHDLLGHTLSVVTLKAELAARLVGRDPARAEAEIREVEQVARAALAQVREAVSGMRTRGLAGELEHARVALKAAGVDLEVEGAPPSLQPATEAVLAMVLREAVTNIIRHAQATACRILLREEAGEAFMEVKDDGRGGTIAAGSGIDGMRARITGAGGRFEIGTEYGTRVRAWLPV